MSGEFVTLVATHTVDEVPDEGGQTRAVAGGPAHYVARALDSLGYPYRLITGEAPRVQVQLRPSGERYLIPPVPPIPLPSLLEGRAVLLSPVIGEINPSAVPAAEGWIAIDLQGFVRSPGRPTDEAAGPFEISDLLARTAVVKSNATELARLTERSRRALDRTLVLETMGSQGVKIYDHGRLSIVESFPVETSNTIGAGDTFLAAFVVSILRGADTIEAATAAARFTEAMLRERLSA
ncbi:MAG TPA: PfkB family carbohydrate kinase [Chloroflexota bacterium]|nr:PfkB family carbohydrate kinase [Chloroflexota bacterium]